MQSEPKPKVWPFNGYAPGNYYCKCLTCKEQFTGDKRAFSCLECAVIASRSIPSPISADAVVEACAKVADGLATEWEGDAELWHKDGMLKTAAISLLHSEAAKKVDAAIRALKGTFPAAPEAKSEVVVKALEWGKTSYGLPEVYSVVGVYRINEAWSGGWAVAFKNDLLRDIDGRQNFATIEAAKAAAQQDFNARVRAALVDPEGGV